jgi:ribosomal-protein-serine acetyltransferase
MAANPLLLRFPDHFETERLLIRAPRAGDGPAVNQAVRESFDQLRLWMPWARFIPSVAESETFAREGAAKFRVRDELPLLLFRRPENTLIGASGMHHIDWDVPRLEIGYWVRTSFQGQGYITEAVLGITDFAFRLLHAERLEIRCDSRNTRSVAVAERAGFSLEACFHHERRDNEGKLSDTLVYARLRGE